jgi:hypothetical protein
LILHVPSPSFVGPKIFLNTLLSNTINLFFMDPNRFLLNPFWFIARPTIATDTLTELYSLMMTLLGPKHVAYEQDIVSE